MFQQTQEDKYFTEKTANEFRYMRAFIRRKFNEQSHQEVKYHNILDQYSRYDGILFSSGTQHITEVKVRTDITTNQIDRWGGQILEEKKLCGIMEQEPFAGHFLYFIYFKDALRVYLCPTSSTYYRWYTKMLPKDSFSKNKIEKLVANLPNSYIVEQFNY